MSRFADIEMLYTLTTFLLFLFKNILVKSESILTIIGIQNHDEN